MATKSPSTSPPTLPGPGLLLRAPRRSDVKDRYSCGEDPEITRMYGASASTRPYTVEDALHWYTQLSEDPLIWVIEVEGHAIGHLRLHSLDTAARRARLAVGLFNPAYLSRGYGAKAIHLILAHAFERMHLHRVDLRTLAYNHRAIRCFEKCGFVREGIERETALVEGVWHSDVMMSILEAEWKQSRAA